VREEEEVLHVSLDRDALQLYLEKLAPALAIEPVDARFHVNGATGELEPITESLEGRALDVRGSLDRVVEQVEAGDRYVSLVLESVPPRYPDSARAEELGIVDLVATGESYFIGSPSGRDHNIRLAASKFDGLIIPPGEIFSFNHHLGEVTAEAGYDESFITAGEQLQMGIGGGICQVSTTAFRAAFWGGYPITERWYHGQRVGYYELRGGGVGMDATVFSPHVDLKFVNDRSAPLLIETEVGEDTHRLVFRFYSTDDGRQVEKAGPTVTDESEPGPPIYELDEDIEPGTVTKWQSAVGGLTATVERWVYDGSGELLHHDTFVSKYEPRRAAYHYGPGYEPPTE
jgi:vancomycin resistance protein YoaR